MIVWNDSMFVFVFLCFCFLLVVNCELTGMLTQTIYNSLTNPSKHWLFASFLTRLPPFSPDSYRFA